MKAVLRLLEVFAAASDSSRRTMTMAAEEYEMMGRERQQEQMKASLLLKQNKTLGRKRIYFSKMGCPNQSTNQPSVWGFL